MGRSRLVQTLAALTWAVLTAGVAVAAARIVSPDAGAAAGGAPELPPVIPVSIRFIAAPPSDLSAFGVAPGGPGAPAHPKLPSEVAAAPKPVAAGPAVTAAHRRASQNAADPASMRWALIIGINDYAGGTRDTIGSYQDAEALRDHLLGLGWMPDHVLLVGNRSASRAGVLEALAWLASKTDARSTVVFHYSGHEKPYRYDADNDGEARDVALWLADNRLISDGKLGAAMGKVRAARMWINLAVCRAGGFDDPGMSAPGRVITYSSPESELSYEDPDVGHSVFGYYSIVEGMSGGAADRNIDFHVSVEEAFVYARPLVAERTSGLQHPVLVDRLAGDFDLRIL